MELTEAQTRQSSTDMTEYTVTAIRHQMGDHLTYDERSEAAERFVAGLKKGQRVMLVAEPDNPGDPDAIAVYLDFKRVGYISREETALVHPLLDESHQCDGVVERADQHVTFFISIPGAPENTFSLASRPRKLPQSPLGDQVWMPYTREENQLQLIASRLMGAEVTKDNLQEILRMAGLYASLLKLSICYDDIFWMNRISKKLQRVYTQRKQLGMSEAEAAELDGKIKIVLEAVGDMHCSVDHWTERVFEEQLNRLRHDEKISGPLYDKYKEHFLERKDFAEADKDLMAAEHKRLCDWQNSLRWSELRRPVNFQKMALKINYLGLSRQELYELYSVLLLIERLEKELDPDAVSVSTEQVEEGPNFAAPEINLQHLLKQRWFEELRTKDAYDEAWTDAFVSALMESEWRNLIAEDWALTGRRNKVNQIKGFVVGLLADSGVLKGSYTKIATQAGLTENPRTFAKYMSEGKNQPYADWVRDYVSSKKE